MTGRRTHISWCRRRVEEAAELSSSDEAYAVWVPFQGQARFNITPKVPNPFTRGCRCAYILTPAYQRASRRSSNSSIHTLTSRKAWTHYDTLSMICDECTAILVIPLPPSMVYRVCLEETHKPCQDLCIMVTFSRRAVHTDLDSNDAASREVVNDAV